MVAFRLSILLALTRIGSLLIIFPILVSATLVIRIRLIHGVDSWLIMEVVHVRFLVVRIHHVVFTAPMVYHLLPILVSSSVWLVVIMAMGLIFLPLIKIPAVLVVVIFLLVVTARFVISIRLLSISRVLVIWIHVAAWLVGGERVILGLVGGGRVVLIIVARAKLLRLISLIAASNSWWIANSTLLSLRFFAQFIVHIMLPNRVVIRIRHRIPPGHSLSSGSNRCIFKSLVRFLGRYGFLLLWLNWLLLILIILVLSPRISTGLRFIVLVVRLRILVVERLMGLKVVVSSVVRVRVVVVVPGVVGFVTILSISVVVPTAIVVVILIVPVVAVHIRGRPVIALRLISLPVLRKRVHVILWPGVRLLIWSLTTGHVSPLGALIWTPWILICWGSISIRTTPHWPRVFYLIVMRLTPKLGLVILMSILTLAILGSHLLRCFVIVALFKVALFVFVIRIRILHFKKKYYKLNLSE